MPTIQKLPLGRLQTNCYILCENPEDGVVVIDPGDDILLLQAALTGKKVAAALITHAHFDHILGLPALGNVPIYVHGCARHDRRGAQLRRGQAACRVRYPSGA